MLSKRESGQHLAHSVFLFCQQRITDGGGLADLITLGDLFNCLPQWVSTVGGKQYYSLYFLSSIAELLHSAYLSQWAGVEESATWDRLIDELKRIGADVAATDEQAGARLSSLPSAAQVKQSE